MSLGNKIKRRILKKIHSNALFVALGIISILGYIFAMLTAITGKIILVSYPIIAIILGTGLMIESRFDPEKVIKRSQLHTGVAKLITFLVGASVVLAGILSIWIPLQGAMLGYALTTNIIAIVVIAYELFWVE